MWSSVFPGMDIANNNILYKRPHVTCRRGPLLYGRLSPYFVFFPFCQPQSLQDSQAPAIAADAFNGLQQAASRREADKNFAPKSEEQNGGTKNQFAEAMLVYTTCRITIPLWNHVLDVQGSHGSFRSIPRFFHHDVLHPLSDQDFTPEVLRQFASEKWQDSWPHPGVKGELHGQHHPAIVWPPNHVLLQNHLLAKLSAALQLIHHRYNSSHILTPIGPSVRHVQLLETQLGKMDQHYDECNSAMATGEVNGYDDKFLS